MINKILISIALLTTSLMNAAVVLAHGGIDHTDPADGAVLESPPEQVRVWFEDPLVPDTGRMNIINGAGEAVDLLRVYQVADDEKLLIADMPPDLPDGAYIVSVSATAATDGHEVTASFVFWVGEKSEAAAPTDESSPTYSLLGLFFGVAVVMGGTGLWLNQRSRLEIVPPEGPPDTAHFDLE